MKNTEAAVATRNRVNAKAMEAQQQITELLRPYLNRKVRKVSGYGGWVAALAPKLDAFYETMSADGYRCWISCDYRWLNLNIDTTYNVAELVGGGHAVDYVKAQLSVGKIDDNTGVLIAVSEPIDLRTDYTLAWVEQTRAEAYRLESEASTLRSQLRDFDR